jgi:phosphohistidine phosphatase
VVEIRFDEQIYMADYSTLIHLIGTLDNNYTRIAIFGHNSGFSDLVSGLSNEPIWLATAACGLVRFQVDSWEEVISDMGKLVSVISAKELR